MDAASVGAQIARIEALLRSVDAPLTAVALRLEQARLRLSHGEDPAESLFAAKEELARAFFAFEKARTTLLQVAPPTIARQVSPEVR